MNELIHIQPQTINGNTVETVSARELHEFLESKQDFSTWVKNRIEKYEFVENQDFITLHKKMEREIGGTVRIEYFVSIGMAKELAMVENNEKGKQARQYFIECEKQLKSNQQVISPDESKMRALSFVISQTSLSDVAKETLLITTAETALGFPINYRPQLEQKTYTATQIGEQLGISANKVGKLTNAHNLKTEKYGIYVLDKARGHDKQVETFRYYDNVIPVLKSILEG